MKFISREEASALMTEEERGREHVPTPGGQPAMGRVVDVSYEEDGAECRRIEPYGRPDETVRSRSPFHCAQLIRVAAQKHGVREDEIRLWLDGGE